MLFLSFFYPLSSQGIPVLAIKETDTLKEGSATDVSRSLNFACGDETSITVFFHFLLSVVIFFFFIYYTAL